MVQHEDTETAQIRADARQEARALSPWALLVVLVGVAVSMVFLVGGYWRKGSFALGLCVLGAGVLRGILPTRFAGLLAARRRWFDTLLLLGLGVGIVALTLVVPPLRVSG
ncbi:MAG TPA: DUF3017 domain-containing protein [Propionibacteriaceae bacterium]|nr:DUF3017 domain-containing protein [Propionibacteriaceae bacterium]